jgi:hypothetical protein
MLKLAAALAALALTAAPAQAGELSWLVGYWIDCDGKAVTESWIDAGSDTLLGVGLTRGRARTSFDFMRIAAGPGGKPTFFAQPQGAPVTPFVAKSVQGQSVVFENLAHDFPQRVIYRREGEVLHARIEGVEKGEASGMDWTYRAAPANTACPMR